MRAPRQGPGHTFTELCVCDTQNCGDFLLVLAVKKEKKRAPQALAGGRKGAGKG